MHDAIFTIIVALIFIVPIAFLILRWTWIRQNPAHAAHVTMAWLTVLIALSAVLQWRATNATNEETEALQRAFVSLENIEFRVKPASDPNSLPRDHEIFVYAKNGGASGAIGEQFTRICWTKDPSDPRKACNIAQKDGKPGCGPNADCGPNGDKLEMTIGPGAHWKLLSATIPGSWIEQLEKGDTHDRLFVFSDFSYRDVFNNAHEAGFCFQIEGGRDNPIQRPTGEVELYVSQCTWPGANYERSYD